MIRNNWKARIAKSGLTQNEVARRASANPGEFSRICQGMGVPSMETLTGACAVLGCDPHDIYGDAELEILYAEPIPQKKKKSPSSVTVRVNMELAEAIDAKYVEDGTYRSRVEAVNALLRTAVQTA